MKAVRVKIGGEDFYLAFNGNALFAVREEFGDTNKLLDRVYKDSTEGLQDTCRVAALLMEQGDLIRRHMGYTPRETPDGETLELILTPLELVELKEAIPKAIFLGFGREVKDKDERVIDLGLAEIREKKRNF